MRKIFVLLCLFCFFQLNKLYAFDSELEVKLQLTVIPHLSCEDMSVAKVIDQLREIAKKRDPEKKGINLIFLNAPKLQFENVDEEVDEDEDFLAEDVIEKEEQKAKNKAKAQKDIH